MEIYANRDFGRIMHGLIRGRMLESHIEPPPFTVNTLGDYLDTLADLMRRHLQRYYKNDYLSMLWRERLEDPGLRLSIHWDPTMQLGMRVFLMMVWTSLLVPDTHHRALQVISHTDEFFGKFNYRRIDDEEAAELAEEIAELMRRPRSSTSLGAAGDALFSAANRGLRRVPHGRSHTSEQRRLAFVRSTREICLEIEDATDLADRKANATLLGEKLRAELEASHSRSTDRIIDQFWQQFDLFFSGTTLAQ